VWDYFTKPEYRKIMMDADAMPVENRLMGRTAPGTVYVCAHGDVRIRHAVLDWRPFEYYTFETDMPMGTKSLVTVQFSPLDGGQTTKMTGACSKPQGSLLARGALGAIRSKVRQDIEAGVEALRKIILEELESGVAMSPQPILVPEEQVAAAVSASVAESLAS
jgi:hypothetical protein